MADKKWMLNVIGVLLVFFSGVKLLEQFHIIEDPMWFAMWGYFCGRIGGLFIEQEA